MPQLCVVDGDGFVVNTGAQPPGNLWTYPDMGTVGWCDWPSVKPGLTGKTDDHILNGV
jgi:hypothetical protein